MQFQMDHFETFVIKFFVWNFLQFEQVSLIFKIFAKCTVNILKTSFHCTVNCTYYAVVQFVHVMYLYSRIYTLYSCNVCTLVLWSTFYVSVSVFCEGIFLSFSDQTSSEISPTYFHIRTSKIPDPYFIDIKNTERVDFLPLFKS